MSGFGRYKILGCPFLKAACASEMDNENEFNLLCDSESWPLCLGSKEDYYSFSCPVIASQQDLM